MAATHSPDRASRRGAPPTTPKPVKKMTAYLIFSARNQGLRIVKQRPPRMDWDEIAFTINITVPEPWGRLAGAITVDLPEGGPAVIEVAHEEKK